MCVCDLISFTPFIFLFLLVYPFFLSFFYHSLFSFLLDVSIPLAHSFSLHSSLSPSPLSLFLPLLGTNYLPLFLMIHSPFSLSLISSFHLLSFSLSISSLLLEPFVLTSVFFSLLFISSFHSPSPSPLSFLQLSF